VLAVHTAKSDQQQTGQELTYETMRKYIAYCKAKCAPRISSEAAEILSDYYVRARRDVRQIEVASFERSSIPSTVRLVSKY
jgi:DNA replication licensing factor MCM5